MVLSAALKITASRTWSQRHANVLMPRLLKEAMAQDRSLPASGLLREEGWCQC